MLRNPIIAGFYPDPSICRVGDDFYLVTSSFEYFPGVPIFHSRDLVHWRQIGHCLTRNSQLPLEAVPTVAGIYAPTLRYHRGWFYMVTTNVMGGGHFYVKTQDPAGPWSEPVWIEGPHFDPDLFFDDADEASAHASSAGDEKVYFSRMDMGNGIFQRQIDLETGQLIGPTRKIWPGFEDRYCEAPHIYKINGMYYLIVAEGGTHRSHMIVCARSNSPTGPFEGCPHNPLLTHRAIVDSPIEHTGHGDLVQAPDGSWWIVFLAVRPYQERFHLGRETFLSPVTWTADGWPVINAGKPIELEMDVPILPSYPWPSELCSTERSRDDFTSPQLGLGWNFRRNPIPSTWSLTDRPGFLRLNGIANSLNEAGLLAFVGQRQRHFVCQARTALLFVPTAPNEEAGLTVLMNEEHHYEIALTLREGQRVAIVRKRIGDLSVEVASRPVYGDFQVLGVNADSDRYTFLVGDEGGTMLRGTSFRDHMEPLATGRVRYLSGHVAGGFTGVYFGLYATGNGKSSQSPADFDWFEYLSLG